MTIRISILIAARNEEEHLKKCVDSLIDQELNEGTKINILIGNDQSVDNTLQIAQQLESNNKNVECYDIPKSNKLEGKLNVLVTLSNKANSDYLLFADADTIYPKTWVGLMTKSLQKTEFITGVTIPFGNTIWSRWQKLEWMLALKNVYLLSKFNIPVTSMGNNMGIKKSTFDKNGGFKDIQNTAVEDYALFHHHIKKKGSFTQLYQREVLAKTAPVSSFKFWLQQRIRWYQGGKKVHPFLIFLNYINIFTLPFLVFFSLLYPYMFKVLLVYYVSKLIWYSVSQKQLGLKIDFIATLLFEPIYTISYASLLVYSLLSPKFDWKGRVYNSE
ncbi:glycosyltransferase [Flammeovirga pacifica]|uniref:Glycosyltransferase 2-like domain-containing protein n=1 Tax=Flammeovirga pacifica TaxID=915059 RepID=A0A1S1Z198_FLAPC|nr:glycosyltransferase [Flammeovirga pacifica]OHX67040.1 hypothetical protein NH26_12135 [Flammeovirga pacifica]